MDADLNDILASQQVPADLSITYSDMHLFWGGTTLTARGDGHLERKTSPRGAPAPTSSSTRIGEQELLELVRLLVDLSAWEQRTADRMPVPDESRAYLTISLSGRVSEMWEWFNDMRAENRLIKIKDWMESQFGDSTWEGPSS